MATSLREALSQRFNKDPEGFYRTIKAQKINLNPQQETSLRQGNWKAFGDDKSLEKIFNSKLLGALGISPKDYSKSQSGYSKGWKEGDTSGKW